MFSQRGAAKNLRTLLAEQNKGAAACTELAIDPPSIKKNVVNKFASLL